MKFGKYAIIDPVTHHFKEEPDWWWKITPPTSGDELARSKFTLQNRIVTDPMGVQREYPPTNTEVMHREVALLFGGTNVPADDDTPILAENQPVENIENVLRQMPHGMVLEIWEAIAEAVPGWGPLARVSPTGSPPSKTR